MTRLRFFRLGLVIVSLWLLGAALSWAFLNPPDALVGARPGGGGAVPTYDLAPSDLSEAVTQLSKSSLWGLQRDGSVPPPQSAQKGAEAKETVWRILAAVSKGKERYIVIQIDKGAPAPLKEGDQLPDGSTLLQIAPSEIIVMTVDDEQRIINLSL